jgi:hypothetical protein
VLRGVIFQVLRVISGDIIQLIIFVCAFYAFEYLLFYSHYNRESIIIVIQFAMGTHQGDLVGKALFVLAHFLALCSKGSWYPSYLFPSIIDDINIIGHPSILSFAYEHFETKICVIGLFI